VVSATAIQKIYNEIAKAIHVVVSEECPFGTFDIIDI
jgi:hypothetical protein